MIDRTFWEEVRQAWIIKPSPRVVDIKIGSGGAIDPSLLRKPWEMEDEIPFEDVDCDEMTRAVFAGENYSVNTEKNKVNEQSVPQKSTRPKLDEKRFDELIDSQQMANYIIACKMLLKCDLPEEISDQYDELIVKIPDLQKTAEKYQKVYETDLSRFCECYIPDALQLTATYLNYLDIGVQSDILRDTEKEVIEAGDKLLQSIREKIDEIELFATMEMNARAKAYNSILSQDGYVDPSMKIN